LYTHQLRLEDCYRISGERGGVGEATILEALLPRADFVALTIGTHPIMRSGTRGCLQAFAAGMPYFTERTSNALRRFVVDLTTSIDTWNRPGGEYIRGAVSGSSAKSGRDEELPNAQISARHEYCSDAMREWVRGSQDGAPPPKWEWADRFAMSWLSPEWNQNAVHYAAQPIAVLLGDAFCVASPTRR